MVPEKRSDMASWPSSLRLTALREDLRRLDKVMTLAQVQRHYLLSFDDLKKDSDFLYRTARFGPLSTSSLRVTTVFVTFKEGERSKAGRGNAELLRWQPGWKLAHLAGTAELRLMLGATRISGAVSQSWVLEGGYGDLRPDATWMTPEGQRVAIEYDAGYPAPVVRDKLRSFQSYDLVYWGTPSAARQTNLQSRYPGQAEFLKLDFFTPPGG